MAFALEMKQDCTVISNLFRQVEMRIRLSHLLLDAAGESAAAVGEGEGGEIGEGDGDAEGECGQRGEGQHRVEAQDEQEDGDLRVLPSLSHSLFFGNVFIFIIQWSERGNG